MRKKGSSQLVMGTGRLFFFVVFCWWACGCCHRYSETGALRCIYEIQEAEAAFHDAHGRFATLAELVQRNMIRRTVANPKDAGYRIRIQLTPAGYEIHGRPIIWGKTGRRNFCAEGDGKVHQTWENRPATLNDLLVY